MPPETNTGASAASRPSPGFASTVEITASSVSSTANDAVANIVGAARHSGRGSSDQEVVRALFVFALAFLVAAGPFVAFQRRLLPPAVARAVSRVYFWPTLPLTFFRCWLNNNGLWVRVDDTLVLGASPLAILGHPEQLHRHNVRGIINLQTEYAGPVDHYAKLNMQQLRLPTLDHTEPSLESLGRAVAFLEEHRRRGESVYVHCKAGHGRSAAIALVWLAYTRGLNNGVDDLELLNKELLEKRRVRKTLHKQENIRTFVAQRQKLAESDPAKQAGPEAEDADMGVETIGGEDKDHPRRRHPHGQEVGE